MSLSKKIALFAANALILCLIAAPAFAQDAANAAASGISDVGVKYLAAAIAIGVAACGCGVGQGIAAKGALEGISRNPSAYGKIFTPMILALALIESLSIYGLLVALLAIFM